MTKLSYPIIFAILLILFILYKFRDKVSVFFKDQSTLIPDQRPFSLSKAIFSFWTILVIFSISYLGIVTGEFPKIESTLLILMGIASGTAVVSRTIDNAQAANPTIKRIQDDSSEGFLKDILTDSNGVSISRFQTICFNLIYGCIFLSTVFTDEKLYHFPDKFPLILLGLSSGAYSLLKIPESQKKSEIQINNK